jgi:hypothetical protein
MTATDFRIARNALCGVQVARGGEMDLHHGVVSNHRVGANVQDPTFDPNRLGDDVRYLDNETILDAQSLPVPEPPAGIAAEGG